MNGLQQPQLMDSQWHKKNRGWITLGLIKKRLCRFLNLKFERKAERKEGRDLRPE